MIAWFYAVAAALLLAAGCAVELRPWVDEYVVDKFDRPLTATSVYDGPPDSEVLVVRNPTKEAREITVWCGSWWRRTRWVLEVPAEGEVRGIAQLMASDVGASTCVVEGVDR